MDPVTLIVAALAAGAGLGLKDAASSAVTDAYSAVKSLARKRFAGRPDGQLALTRYEEAQEVWEAPLVAELTAARAGGDQELVVAAQSLMALLDEPGSRAGKYTVDARGSQGVQVGDRSIQHNTFGTP
jgi:hypothetical protein